YGVRGTGQYLRALRHNAQSAIHRRDRSAGHQTDAADEHDLPDVRRESDGSRQHRAELTTRTLTTTNSKSKENTKTNNYSLRMLGDRRLFVVSDSLTSAEVTPGRRKSR